MFPCSDRPTDLFPRTERSPVGHDLNQAVVGQTAQCLNDGVPGHAVMLSQLGYGWQALARLPFPGVAPSAQVVFDPARRQLAGW